MPAEDWAARLAAAAADAAGAAVVSGRVVVIFISGLNTPDTHLPPSPSHS